MLQLILSALRRRQAAHVSDCQRWLLDPLSHPALRQMDARALADLPIGHADSDECECPDQGHFTSGGRLDRIEFTLPPVLRPKMVPRS